MFREESFPTALEPAPRAARPGAPRADTGSARPWLGAAILLIFGILGHRALPHAPRLWLSLAIACAAVALASRLRAIASTAALAGAIVLTGLAVAQLDRFGFGVDHIAAFTTDSPRLAQVEVILDQPPRTLSAPASLGRQMPPRQAAQGEVTRIRTRGGWKSASGRLILYIDEPHPLLAHGQRIIARGMLSRPRRAMNPGEFDLAIHQRRERILASLDAPRADNLAILQAGAVALHERWLHGLRRWVRAALDKGFSEAQATDHALLTALLLGEGDPRLAEVRDDFRRTGASHHLAISGMHVAILGGFVFLLCRLSRLAPRRSAAVMIGFVLLYGLVVAPSPPVGRSIILCLVIGAGMMLRRRVDGVNLLALTAFCMLLAQPLSLYAPGFQLSFVTVLGLMTLASPLAKKLDREDEDQRVVRSMGIAPPWSRRIGRWCWRHVVLTLSAALVAWVVSAPMVMQHFDQVNPLAVLASLLLEIAVLPALVAGLLKVVLTIVLPGLAGAWAGLAVLPVALMRWMAAALAALPGVDLPAPALPAALIVMFYALLALALLRVRGRSARLLARGGVATACMSLALLPFLGRITAGRGPGEHLRLTLLSVGAGQCAVIELPSGKTILIDAGSSTIAELSGRVIEPFLRTRGIRALDGVFISHADLDHFSALPRLSDRLEIRRVFLTGAFLADAPRNPAAAALIAALGPRRLTVTAAGARIQLDDSTALEVLWPPADGAPRPANDTSLVLRLSCAGRTILFTGDIQRSAIDALLQRPEAIAADVLIAPHHGSAEASTPSLLEAAAPAITLASSDRTPSRKQRDFDELMRRRGQPLLRTGGRGAITARIAADGALGVETFIGQ